MSRVSVIIPAYNTEKYIGKCISSILAQTYTDFELIVVDDGSSDKTPKIIDDFAKQDPRVRPIHKFNAGVSAARNTGLNNATGEFVLFVDSDDYIAPTTLERAIAEYDSKHCEIIQFNFCNVKDGVIAKPKKRFNKEGYVPFPLDKWSSVWFSVCYKLVKRSLYEDNNLRFYEWTNQNEDTAMCILLFSYVNGVYCIEDYLYYRISREDSLLHTMSKSDYVKRIKTLFATQEDLKRRNRDPKYSKLIHSMIRHNIRNVILGTYRFKRR